jgi:hypothetical protein
MPWFPFLIIKYIGNYMEKNRTFKKIKWGENESSMKIDQ